MLRRTLWLVGPSLLVWAACSDGPATVATGSGGSGSGVGGGAGETSGTGGSNATGMGGSGVGGLPTVPPGQGLGEDCSADACRAGLECVDDVCELGGSTEEGDPCIVSGECEAGLKCIAQTCTEGEGGPDGAPCQTDVDCDAGLRCAIVGFGAQCVPEGSTDVGGNCSNAGDCLSGLTCIQDKCQPVPPGAPPFGVPTWDGVDCEMPEEGKARAYFEVPGAEDALEGDFFRLPFPNDARIVDGELDLAGFPTPGDELLGFDPLQIYIDRLTETQSAWGTDPTVLFRFSGRIDHLSFVGEEAKADGRLRWVDISPGLAPEELDNNAGWRIFYHTGRGNYVCNNWFGVRRYYGSPLRPGHTYAVILTTGGRTEDGDPIERSENFAAMMSDSAPSDAALDNAHEAYAPLREYIAASDDLTPDDVLVASVITVGPHRQTMEDLAAAVEAEDPPVASGWVRCGDDPSPCPDAEGVRACADPSADYAEYHALVTLPVFQSGTAPYETSGGAIDTSSGPVRSEEVCLALTVPTGSAAPSSGWPLVIYAHGTNGNFRGHVRDEVAGELARASTPFAVLGIDQVQHGPRRGTSTRSPDQLFFNFLNPDAAQGNPLQGAADQLSLIRFARTIDLSAAESGGEAILIDPAQVSFLGHSQGSTHGSIMLPYSDIPGAVFSGNGGSLTESLIAKKQPVNIAGALPMILLDPNTDGSLLMGPFHPALTILQQWIDSADPINYAFIGAARPEMGRLPHHVFQTFGMDDSYAPPKTILSFGIAALGQIAPHPSGVDPNIDNSVNGYTAEDMPISGNRTSGGTAVTVAMRQYNAASGSDGHFVIFDVPQANQDVIKFLVELAAGDVPTVGE